MGQPYIKKDEKDGTLWAIEEHLHGIIHITQRLESVAGDALDTPHRVVILPQHVNDLIQGVIGAVSDERDLPVGLQYIKSLQDEIESLCDVEKLHDRLDEVTQERDMLKRKVDTYRHAVPSLRHQLGVSQVDAMPVAVNALHAEVEVLKEQRDLMAEDNAGLEQELAAAKKQAHGKFKEKMALRTENRESNRIVNNLKDRLASKDREIRQAYREIERLQGKQASSEEE